MIYEIFVMKILIFKKFVMNPNKHNSLMILLGKSLIDPENTSIPFSLISFSLILLSKCNKIIIIEKIH